jgi:hypothetical protein
MAIVSTNLTDLSLLSMAYSSKTGDLRYEFLADGQKHSFLVKAMNSGGIRGVELTEILEQFIQPYLALNHLIPKILSKLTWDYIEGRPVTLPVKFI